METLVSWVLEVPLETKEIADHVAQLDQSASRVIKAKMVYQDLRDPMVCKDHQDLAAH